MVEILRDNPLLLLFAVAAIGYSLGRIRLGGASLGVAAVLFTGLAACGLHPDLKLPELGTLWIGYRLLRIPMGLLLGILAGLQTQPAVLGFAAEQTQDDLPNLGYATVYPVAALAKILLAQVLFVLLD